MIWRSQASFRVRCVVLTVAIALPSFATLSFAGSKRSRVLHAHPTTNIGTVSATSTAAAAPAQILRPRFDAPPLFAANGRNVGIGGLYSMAKGDFNGDGIPDFAAVGFACANGVGDSVTIYLGNGDGTFKTPAAYPAGACPFHVAVGRLRGPNAPEDLIMADEGFNADGLAIALGNGDGTFQPPIIISLPSAPSASVVADFNGDGKVDIAVSMFGGDGTQTGLVQSVAILLGHGDGTFDAPAFYQGLNNPYGIDMGDFNNDGKIDIVIRNPEALALLLGNGDGTFLPGYVILAEPSTLISVTPPGPILNGLVSFVIGDFNEDGNLDIAAGEDGERVDVILGTGTGTFTPPVTYLNNEHQTGFGGGQLATAKLSNSGHLDLVVSTGYGTTLGIFHGNGNGTFTGPDLYPLPQYDDEGLILIDVNGDGRPDIVSGTNGGRGLDPNFLTVLLNKGNGDFGAPPGLFSIIAPYDQLTATNAVGITLADLAHNGKLDAVVTDWDVPIEPLTNGQTFVPPNIDAANMTVDTHGTISVLAGNGDGTFQTEKQYFVGGRPIAVQTADLSGDGKIDIVVVNAFDNQLSILKGNGDRTYQAAISIPLGANPNALAIADLNGDDKPDIAVTNLADNTVSILINQSTPGTITFAAPVNYSVGTFPAGVVAVDFNHDGKLDLATVNAGYYFAADDRGKHTTLSFLAGNGDGTFAPAVTQTLWSRDGGDAIVAADFGRREVDLAVSNFGTPFPGEVMILKSNGDGTFAPGAKYQVNSGAESIVAADFNRDGKIDLAINGLNDYSVAVLVGNGDGTFVPPTNANDDTPRPFGFVTWGYPAYMAAGDLNGDGKPEIVTTHLFEAAIAVLRNTSIPPVHLINVVSRKIHGAAGTFDVDLAVADECRSGGATSDYTLVFNFESPLASVGGASVTGGTGNVTSSAIGSDPHQYIVNLTGVTNAQTLTISLSNVADSAGSVSGAVSTSMGVLIGDTNGNRAVNSSDIAQTQSQSGQSVNSTNFREDVTVSGSINSSDIALVQSKSGTGLP